MRKCIPMFSLVSLLLTFVAGYALAEQDLAELRRDIDRNGWSFEVSDHFSSTLTEEKRQHLRGLKLPDNYDKIFQEHLKIFPEKRDLPSNFNWVDMDGVTPVKDQGQCGSCWAFSATAELEARIKIEYGVELNLSEQQVVQCNPYGADCDGGWAGAAYWVFRQYGAVLENCYPYVGASTEPCQQNNFKKYGFVTGWYSISNNETQIKNALMNGPVTCSVDAEGAWESYGGGCYDVPGGYTNHSVLLVGYDDRACGGNGAWLIKNSWGPDFGEGGYIWIEYGASSISNFTQIEFTPPPTGIDINASVAEEPLYAGETFTLTWETTGTPAPTVDIWFGDDGHCHDYLVVENLPNTGSYDWVVPNLGAQWGSLMIQPSSGTQDGFGITEDYIQVIGHKTRYVSLAGSNTAPYETPGTAAHSIGNAVAACTGTDTVLVAGGEYVGTVAVGSTVKLFGGYSADFSQRDLEAYPSVITSGSTGMRFTEGAGTFGGVDGFTFRNCTGGNTSAPVSGRHGGGIYVSYSSPIINNCRFEDNQASTGVGTGYGGAICVLGGSPVITDCYFTGNKASNGGAVGVFDGAVATFSDCVFTANSCSDSLGTFTGAGFFVEAAEVRLNGGSLLHNGGSGSGGGLHVSDGTAVLDGVELRGNRAVNNGGGLLGENSQVTVLNSDVQGNISIAGSGGGLAFVTSDMSIRNTRIAGNNGVIMGGGLFGSSVSGVLENCLVMDNSAGSGGGMMVFSAGVATVRNNIVTGNSGGGMMAVGAEMAASHNNAWQNVGGDYVSMSPGEGGLSLDPVFVDAAAGDYGLGQHSPCIDGGAVDASCLDPDGSRADMGLLGGPAADFVAPDYTKGAALTDLGGGSWRLDWDASTAPNISHYVVYRDTVQNFVPSPTKALATVTHPLTTYEDAPGHQCYYLVAAVDSDGYAGGYSEKVFTEGDLSAASGNELPRSLAFTGVVPNPFNPVTTISFDVPRTGAVRLAVFDLRGRLVEELVSGQIEAGKHTVQWDGTDRNGHTVAAGVYFARMDDGRDATTTKMVLAK
jgi:cathepsin K